MLTSYWKCIFVNKLQLFIRAVCMTCRALAVAEGELQRAGEQIAEYQNVNRDLVAQADDSKQHLQVKLHRSASCSCCCLYTQHNTDMQHVICVHTIISPLANACAPCLY